MQITDRKTSKGICVNVDGDIVFHDRNKLKEHVLGLLQSGQSTIILNLKGCTYIDSSGLGMLGMLLKAAQQKSARLLLINLNHTVREILEVTDLIHLFTVVERKTAS